VFFNPSLRTRTSFELGAFQLGGTRWCCSRQGRVADRVRPGTVMDGDAEEHIAEGRARAVALRRHDRGARVPEVPGLASTARTACCSAFAKHATVPVINMETITHPCRTRARDGAAAALRARRDPRCAARSTY
jgi:N-acetylornithine carbamoyltransferase